ncbi:carbon monoxide dehydrogenase beta subunit family protein [Bacillus cereus]|uniref:carbon monoxide dehydrogenase beta subunit family protein n=1 Tax=Bacillus cereus TaxID=1396 RepID=UPI001145EF25|nr:carbon monoxide dehydrogenase beta subunit family protein [Bacillus cereus]
MKKIIGSIFASSVLLVTGCNSDDVDEAVNKADKKVKEEVTVATTKDHEYVQMIKSSKLPDYETMNIEEAFYKFFKNPKWKYFKSKDNEEIVEFTGNCLYREQEVKAKVQFVINKADNTFKLKAMALNDIPQNELELTGMLRSIYGMTNDNSEQKEDTQDNNSDQSNQEEVNPPKPEGSVKADSYFEEDRNVEEVNSPKPEGSVKADSYFEEDRNVEEVDPPKPEGSVKADSYFE